jgi:hypothetical protein
MIDFGGFDAFAALTYSATEWKVSKKNINGG